MQSLVGTKVTFDLVCNGYGWSYTFFLPTQSSGFAVEIAAAVLLAGKINNATNSSTYVAYIRCQSLSNLRQGQIFPQTVGMNVGTLGVQPQSALYLRLYNSPGTLTKLTFFRGLNQNLAINGGQINPSSSQVASINGFLATLVSGGWCWLGKAIGNPLPGPPFNQLSPQPVTSVTNGAGGFPLITFAGPVFNAFSALNAVKLPLSLSGLKGCDTLNGTWSVYALTASTCQFVKQVLFNPWVGPSGTGHSSWLQLIPIASGVQERLGERKVGRPSYLSRGRSSRRRVVY